jgi:hypothetical protein
MLSFNRHQRLARAEGARTASSTASPPRFPARWQVVITAALVVTLATTSISTAVTSTGLDGEAPPELVILARSDNPADALASGPVGGVLGAPVLLTPSTQLHPATAAALERIDPDLVVLAGGTAALSAEVEQAVAAMGYTTRRAAGADRHATAAKLADLLAEYGTGRPVLTGTPVTDQVIPGLNAELLQGRTPEDFLAAAAAAAADAAAALGAVADVEEALAAIGEVEDALAAVTGARVTYVPTGGDPLANGAALRTAIEQLDVDPAEGTWIVRIHPGVYDLGSEGGPLRLPPGVVLVGPGPDLVEIRRTTSAPMVGPESSVIVAEEQAVGTRLRGLSVEGQSSGTPVVAVHAESSITLEDSEIGQNTYGAGEGDSYGLYVVSGFAVLRNVDLTGYSDPTGEGIGLMVETGAVFAERSRFRGQGGTGAGVVIGAGGFGESQLRQVRFDGFGPSPALRIEGPNTMTILFSEFNQEGPDAVVTDGELRIGSTLREGDIQTSGPGTAACFGNFTSTMAPTPGC